MNLTKALSLLLDGDKDARQRRNKMTKRTVNDITVMIPKNGRDIFIKHASLSDEHYQRIDCFDPDILANFEHFLDGINEEKGENHV